MLLPFARPRRWLLTITAIFLATSQSVAGQFLPDGERRVGLILKGSWQSCPEADDEGRYTEQAFEYQWRGKILWNLHLGPRDEFALFPGSLPPIHVAHDSPANRLTPAFHYDDVRAKAGGRNWSSLGVKVNAVRVQTDDPECYRYFVLVEAEPSTARFAGDR